MGVQRDFPGLFYHDSGTFKTVSYNANAYVGDLLVVAIANRYLPSLPEGFQTVHVVSGTNQSGRLAYKILTAADIGTLSFTYTLSQAGTGSVATFVFMGGTFDPNYPISAWTDSIKPDINEFMPYLLVSAGQTMWHYASARTTDSPGDVFAQAELPGWFNQVPTIKQAKLDLPYPPDVEASIYGTFLASDSTAHVTWTGTKPSTGSYKVSFVTSTPGNSSVFYGLQDGVGHVLVAAFAATVVSPYDGEVVSVNNPTLTAFTDGKTKPYHVQFRVADTADFTNVLWSVTLDNQFTGNVSAQVGVALQSRHNYWWQARVGDDTSWGPWCDPGQFRVEAGQSEAHVYIYENVGCELTTKPLGTSYQLDNVGITTPSAPGSYSYLFENVGFLPTISPRGLAYLYENVDTTIPQPYLWFAYKTYGFAEDHVWLYGQGLGTLADQYHATVKLDYGPNYGVTDASVPIFDWSTQGSSTDAFGTKRQIYPGTDSAPPVVNVECDIVEIVVPSEAVATTVQNDFFYFTTDGGSSNRVPFLLYPVIPLPMETSPSQNSSGGAVRIGGAPVGPTTEIVEHYAGYTIEPYMLASGRLERVPQLSAISRSNFQLSVTDPTSNLEDPVTATVPTILRWRPLSGDVIPRSDLGTGVSLWTPSTASKWGVGQGWKVYADTAPYVDAQHAISSRNGDIPRPAMVFPGNAYAELLQDVPAGPNFTIGMVVQLYARKAQKQVLLSSNGLLPANTVHFELSLTGDLLSFSNEGVLGLLNGSGRLAQFRLPQRYFGERPFYFVLTFSGKSGWILVTTDSPRASRFITTPLPSQMGLWLGRAGDGDPGTMATMDVLDLAMDSSFSSYQAWRVANAFNSIYGVTNT